MWISLQWPDPNYNNVNTFLSKRIQGAKCVTKSFHGGISDTCRWCTGHHFCYDRSWLNLWHYSENSICFWVFHERQKGAHDRLVFFKCKNYNLVFNWILSSLPITTTDRRILSLFLLTQSVIPIGTFFLKYSVYLF